MSEGQQPLDGGEPGVIPPINLQENRSRVTAETVKQAQIEREHAYISLMDEMEKSVGEKGQYFVEFGHKKDTSRGHDSDTRALLLIKSTVDSKSDSNIFIVITREGAKGLRFISQDKGPQGQDVEAEEQMKSIIKHTSEEKQRGGYQPEDISGLRRDGKLVITYLGNSVYVPSEITEIRPLDFETVKMAIEESQRAAEIPHFVKLQQEQQQLTDANALLGVIRQLPPKQ